jgi:hypothetical protein
MCGFGGLSLTATGPFRARPGLTSAQFCYNIRMSTPSALDQFLNPDAGWLTPVAAQRLIDWKVNDELRDRIEVLGRKANLGELTIEEDSEYRAYLDDAELISLMQAKARQFCRTNG